MRYERALSYLRVLNKHGLKQDEELEDQRVLVLRLFQRIERLTVPKQHCIVVALPTLLGSYSGQKVIK